MVKPPSGKPKPKKKKMTDKEQSERFIETARILEADETGESFLKVADRLLVKKQSSS